MKTLIKNAKLIYPGHKNHGKLVSVVVQNGKTTSINPKEVDAKHVIDAKEMLLFPALVDSLCHSGEPGFEDKEDFDSLTQAARNGGYSKLCILPNTDPIVDSKSEVSYISKHSGLNGVGLLSIGSVSKETEGKELSEMFDMHRAGAIAFSDGKKPISDVNMMKRALEYTKNFDGLIVSYPMDDRLAPGGMVNESTHNTSLGLKLSPVLAEELMLNRDIYLLEYASARLHIACVSTRGSIELIKRGKKANLKLSCGVSMANLLFNEEVLSTFDTNYKVSPPLRGESDRKALLKAVRDGHIDVIQSDHSAETIENKDVEFDQAAYGMTMLETTLAAYNMYLTADLSWDEFIQASSLNPRKVFGLDLPVLEKGEPFEFTLFDPKKKWRYDGDNIHSKAVNSPFIGSELTGRVIHLS